MSEPAITLDFAIQELRLEILGKQDWLSNFGHGSKKPRPDHEIASKQKRLAVMQWVLAALERKAGK